MAGKRRRTTTQALACAVSGALTGDQAPDGGYNLDGLHEAHESIGHGMMAGKTTVIPLESQPGSGQHSFRLVIDDGEYADGGTWDVVITRVHAAPLP